MAGFTFRYELEEAGWARVALGNGDEEVEGDVSYLGDPLAEILALACLLTEGEGRANEDVGEQVHFVDEPGGLLFRFVGLDGEKEDEENPFALIREVGPQARLRYEVWTGYDNWDVLDDRKLAFTGVVAVSEFVKTVFETARGVLMREGFVAYRERWFNSEFPLERFARLAKLLGHATIEIPL